MPIRECFLAGLAMHLLFYSSGCSRETKTESSPLHLAAKEFLHHVANQQFDEAWNMVSDSQKKTITFSRFKLACAGIFKRAHLENPTVQIKACSEKDGKGLAQCALVQGSKRYKVVLQLRLEQDQWLVLLGKDFLNGPS